MNGIATTIKQSKKLIELGIDINTADMHYNKWDNDEEEEYHLKCGGLPKLEFKYATNIPAWSLSALIELMPEHIVINNKVSNSLKMDKEEGGIGFCYFFGAIDKVDDIVICDMTPINAAFEMVCYLLENKLI